MVSGKGRVMCSQGQVFAVIVGFLVAFLHEGKSAKINSFTTILVWKLKRNLAFFMPKTNACLKAKVSN